MESHAAQSRETVTNKLPILLSAELKLTGGRYPTYSHDVYPRTNFSKAVGHPERLGTCSTD
jgi:hypothetical protein